MPGVPASSVRALRGTPPPSRPSRAPLRVVTWFTEPLACAGGQSSSLHAIAGHNTANLCGWAQQHYTSHCRAQYRCPVRVGTAAVCTPLQGTIPLPCAGGHCGSLHAIARHNTVPCAGGHSGSSHAIAGRVSPLQGV